MITWFPTYVIAVSLTPSLFCLSQPARPHHDACLLIVHSTAGQTVLAARIDGRETAQRVCATQSCEQPDGDARQLLGRVGDHCLAMACTPAPQGSLLAHQHAVQGFSEGARQTGVQWDQSCARERVLDLPKNAK